jgi:hypothetical protein
MRIQLLYKAKNANISCVLNRFYKDIGWDRKLVQKDAYNMLHIRGFQTFRAHPSPSNTLHPQISLIPPHLIYMNIILKQIQRI